MNKNKWSDLPNAHHIDWVIESLRENPKLWAESWGAVSDAARRAAWEAAWETAWEAAEVATRDAARDAARHAAWEAAPPAAWAAEVVAARNAARDAVAALVAYDDCDQFLSMKYEKLQIWASLSEHPAAVLLLPIVYVRKKYETK